jgi:hypothetical protein
MMIQYTPAEFRNFLMMSHDKHLLVEGIDDKIAFKLLFEELSGKHDIKIDTAERLINFERPLGNREKVEEICRTVTGRSFADKLVGFVDREFREFEWDNDIRDNLGQHKVDGRLVWSRGHSIENYFFDFIILREALDFR